MIVEGPEWPHQMMIRALPPRKSVHPARLMEKKQQERPWRKRRTEKMYTGIPPRERCAGKEEISWLEPSSNLRNILHLGDAKEQETERLSPHLSGSADPNPPKINHLSP